MAQGLLAYPGLQVKVTVEPKVSSAGRTSLPLAGSPGYGHDLAGDNTAPVSSQIGSLAGKPKTPAVLSQGMDQRAPDLPSHPKLFRGAGQTCLGSCSSRVCSDPWHGPSLLKDSLSAGQMLL